MEVLVGPACAGPTRPVAVIEGEKVARCILDHRTTTSTRAPVALGAKAAASSLIILLMTTQAAHG
jgi:hypothetical protein